MKKNYVQIQILLLFLCLIAFKAGAQLNGVYTINSGQPTGGGNYQTFNDCATALNTLGVSGAVTINVVANTGPYTEQVAFTQAVGASAIFSIVVNGNGNLLTFANGTSLQPWILALNGADYMTFNNLNVEGTNPTYNYVCKLWNSADNNNFNNCTFTCPAEITVSQSIPISLSNSGNSFSTSGNGGNNNVWTGCTTNSGYAGATFYGLSSAPYSTGNKLINCNFRDFYLYGIYNVYQRQYVFKGNVIERLNRTAVTTCYGILMTTGSINGIVDGNRVRKVYENSTGYTGTVFGIYISASSLSGQENLIQNNVISDINFAGSIYGIYNPGYLYQRIYHNTIAIDDLQSTSTGITYAIYNSGSTGVDIRNNIITISRGGAGSKYGLYYQTTGFISNYNNIYINAQSGLNMVGYYNANFQTLANWQTANGNAWDQNSMSVDPLYINPVANNYLPTSNAINNSGTPVNTLFDITGLARNTGNPNPDPGAYEFLNTPCSSIPAANSVITPTGQLCPGSSALLTMLNNYTLSGLTFQWQSSTTSSVGPFAAVPGGTNQVLNSAALNQPIWFQAVVTCTNGGFTINALAGQVLIAGVTTSVVPYFEGFEGITKLNQLPNCSWAASNIPATTQTYTMTTTANRIARTGSKYAAFYYSPAGTKSFYSNGIQLNAGVTYSASLWYVTEVNGYNNWEDLSILVGPNQTTVNQIPVASSGGAAIAPFYRSLSNIFTVPTSGIYYVNIRARSNTNSFAQYLSWDDLEIIAPCVLGNNSPTVNVGAPTTTICSGQSVMLTASGATGYLWDNGATSAAISVSPNVTTTYTVSGTDQNSGCSSSVTKEINVSPLPQINVISIPPSVCYGKPISLVATGGVTYSWSTGANGAVAIITPSATTVYSVFGTNQYGCTGKGSQLVTVLPIPNIQVQGTSTMICVGESAVLTAVGAGAVPASYKWYSNAGFIQQNPVFVNPLFSTSYTVTGTDPATGCSGSSIFNLGVSECLGIHKSGNANTAMLFPNPGNGLYSIELQVAGEKTMVLNDLTGRVVYKSVFTGEKTNLDIRHLSNGVYYLQLKSADSTQIIKVVKE